MSKFLLLIAMVVATSSCTSLISGSRIIPIAPEDSHRVDNARMKLFAPRIVPAKDDLHPVLLCKFGFDGTLNDESRVPEDERKTMVGYIHLRLPDMLYHPGVGMQGNGIDRVDLVTGASMIATAELGRKEFIACAEEFMKKNPSGEVRVFVTGFSRGAATARHFMHIVAETWEQQFADTTGKSNPSLRFYALLFDTVATGQQNNQKFHLELTPYLNYLVHFVARDEPRQEYQPDVDVPVVEDLFGTFPARVNTIYLPGAHSDIGASYPQGIGDDYQQLTKYVLSMFGLIPDHCFINPVNSKSIGKHDSRGVWHRFSGVAAPDSDASRQRAPRLIQQTRLTEAQAANIRASNLALTEANMSRPFEFISTETTRINFTAKRSGRDVSLTGVASELSSASTRLMAAADGSVTLEFKFVVQPPGSQLSKIRISSTVVDRIKSTGSDIGITYTQIPNGLRMNFYVDGVGIEHLDMLKGESMELREMVACSADETGG